MEPYAFDRILMRESAEIVAQEMSERIKAIRLSVITETRKYLSQYARLGYMPELQCAIAKKKCARLKTISTQEQARRFNCSRGGTDLLVGNFAARPAERGGFQTLHGIVPADTSRKK